MVVVVERHHHAFGPGVGGDWTRACRRRPIALDARDLRSKASREMQPVNAFLEKRIAARHRFVVPPVAGGFQLFRNGHEVRKHHLANRSVGQQPAKGHRQRFVMIVFADQHHAIRAIPRVNHRAEIVRRGKRGLLHQHVFARGQRLQRQVQMEPRRHRNHDGIHPRVMQGGGVVRVRP